ncbi:NDUFA12-domain-containing protein [Peniophora sp. CONT]|nr:NDUFA12-domain-containing protein [Peniophora sp. CONT]
MVSLSRYFRQIRRAGLKEYMRQMMYIGDAKAGTLVGKDQFGNRYFENLNPDDEVPGRHRWVDLAQHEYNATQVPPEWHSWISHIRKEPPTADKIIQASTQKWQAPWIENLTGTRGAYRSYNTAKPKIQAWDGQTSVQRGGA